MLYNEEIELDEDFEGVDDSGAEVVTEFDEIDENTDYDNNYTYVDIDFPQDTPKLIETPDPVVDPVVEDEDPIPDPEYETISEIYEIIIQEYSQEYLQELSDGGYTFYVVYEDGTEDEVDISEIEEPTTSIEFLDDEAYVIANSILEHFWDDSAGVHVTQDSKEAWAQLVEDNFPDLDATHPHHNIIVNSYGVLIRSALKNLVQLSRSALAFYDGLGNNSSNIISTFGRGGIQIGPTDQKHLVINNNGITVYNGDGTIAPLTASNIQAIEANIQTLTAADAAITGRLTAAEGNITTLTSSKANVTDLTAATARITSLEGDHVTVSDFQAEQANIDNLQTATADIATIRANSAKVANLTAQQLEADHATVGSLSTNYAHISNGVIDNAKIDQADVNNLSTNYAQVNMANVNNAWIQNGTVKDGAITNAMINSVSANKLTAGTIDASNITVTNLNADNITTGTINGQRIGAGSLSLDKLAEDVYTETEVDAKLSTMQSQIDGAIETWTGTTVPTLQNSPASSWNTDALKDSHVGDVYFVVNSQSQQNGYNYRFTKSGSTYSWQLIKDTDITNALQRISTAEGKITTFDSDISQLKTDTGTLTTKTTSLETRMSDAENDILDKVDTTTFNSVSDTVDQHTQTISQHTTAISNKADSSTVTAVTVRVSKNEQDISGLTTSVGQLQTTVETKADGSDVTTISNKLNTISDTVDGHTQSITSLNTTIATEAAKAQSRGIQLVTNGNGFMGNNTNWHTLIFDGTKTNVSPGSFTHAVESPITIMSDECFPIDVSKDYLFEFDVMSVDGSARFYSFLVMCDVDKNIIGAQPVMYYVNTLTTLANDLNPGDTTVRLTSATNWASTTASDQRSLIFWDYTNSFGYTYPEESYSRNYYADIYANDNAVDKSTGVITLKAPWSGPKKLAGTKVSQNHSGSTYVYAQGNKLAPTEWTHFSFVYSGLDLVKDGSDSSGKFRQGTAFAKVGFLWNYNHSTANPQTQMWVTNISVKENVATGSAVTALTTRVTNAESAIEQHDTSIALKANSSDVYTIQQSDGLISEEVTNRNSAITAATNAITLSVSQTYTTKTEAAQMAQPNLSPFFSMAPTNVYNATTNPDGYWASGWTLEQPADGWAHIDFSNTGTSTRWLTIYEHCVWRHQAGDLKGSTKYTVMFEFRNVTKTGKVTCIGMTQSSTSWPSMFIGDSEQGNVAVADGVQYHVGTTVADPASVTGNACTTRTLISFPAGSSLDAEFRVSLYEGEYTGPYKPYSGDMMYATNSELKVTAEGINTEVSKKVGSSEIISKINQSAETVKIQASKVEIDGAAIFSNTAFRQAADTAYDAKGSAQTVQNNLDNLEIGGRNLLPNSQDWSGATKRTNGTITVTSDTYGGCAVLTHVWDSGNSDVGYQGNVWTQPIEADTWYTLSFWAKASSNVETYSYFFSTNSVDEGFNSSGKSTTDADGAIKNSITTEWQRVWVSWHIKAGATAFPQHLIVTRLQSVHSGVTLYISGPKLEKGNKATDWTPAPEDVDSAILADGVEYITGTQAAATGSWVGVTRDSSLVAGKTIAYKLPYAGSGNASLQLKDSSGNNVGGNIAVYSMTTRVTTHYPAGSIIQMTYDGTYWRTAGWYNTNNYDRILHYNYILVVEAVASGALACATSAGYKQIKASQTFDMSYPILWASGAWTAGNQYDNAYEAYPSINPATTGTVQNIVKNATVYLKGTISGNTFTCASSNFLTCTVPTSADNFFYIPLGVVANDATTKMYFSTSRDLYAFIDGKFRQVTPTEIVSTHRIYYRSASATKPSAPSSWIAEATGNVYNQWTTKVPPLAANTTAGQTKYLYLYTCEQRQRLDGTLTCTTVQLDENTTVIDGGQIITNSITAEQIAAGAITTEKLDTDNLLISTGNIEDLDDDLSGIQEHLSSVSLDLYGGVTDDGDEVQSVYSIINDMSDTIDSNMKKAGDDAVDRAIQSIQEDLTEYVTKEKHQIDIKALDDDVQSSSSLLNTISTDLYGAEATEGSDKIDPIFVTSTVLDDRDEQIDVKIDNKARDTLNEVDKSYASTKAEFTELKGYIAGYVDETTQVPMLVLGQRSGAVQAILTNSVLDFIASTDVVPVASIGIENGNGLLKVTRANIGELNIGDNASGHWQWQQRQNGNLALKFISESE